MFLFIFVKHYLAAICKPSISSQKSMKISLFILFLGLLHVGHSVTTSLSEDGPLYDHTAYTECKLSPEAPLYNGGIIKPQPHNRHHQFTIPIDSTAFVLDNLTGNTIYSFSSWIKIRGASSGLINATLTIGNNTALQCIGTVLAKKGCWSFLKGGFTLNSPLTQGQIHLEDAYTEKYNITISGSSLQPFTEQQWKLSQQNSINRARKRAAILHVSGSDGKRLQGAKVVIEQVSREFPFGSAISKTIIGNLPYQNWFLERFNTAVFENELKWYETETYKGQLNYTIPDQLLEFTRRNNILVRGHNIFWEDSWATPEWVRNLTDMAELKSAVNFRMQSLMGKYKNEFVHWDVSNEMLHWDFYEQRLGANASLDFFLEAQKLDPLARLFMNDYNVLENSKDKKATVDAYVARLRELERGGVVMGGIGLEGHFSDPSPPLIRAVLDKLATLDLPIWLTEVDIRKVIDQQTQAKSLEVVLREAFSHPAVNGIILWAALHPNGGCYRMCLTDKKFENLPTGDMVDSLLKEWQTVLEGVTDDHGTFDFSGFFGDYKVTAVYGHEMTSSIFSLSQGHETRHWNILL